MDSNQATLGVATLTMQMQDLFSSFDSSQAPRERELEHTPQRHFLGWNQPFLRVATAWLIEHCCHNKVVDLAGVLAVVPGRRAARLLEASLVMECESRGLSLFPPAFVTPGQVPQELVNFPKPTADPTTTLLSWMLALKSATAQTLGAIFGSAQDRSELLSPAALRSRASTLMDLHEELLGHGTTLQDACERVAEFARQHSAAGSDVERWSAILSIATSANARLAGSGLADPSLLLHQTVASPAADIAAPRTTRTQRPGADTRRLTLVGVHEFSESIARAIRHAHVLTTVLVASPESLSDRFDLFGRVIPQAWKSHRLGIDPDSLRFASSPQDQAGCVLDFLAELGDSRSVDEVAVAVPDAEVLTAVMRRSELGRTPTFRNAAGIPVDKTGPVRVLSLLAALLDSCQFSDFTALCRHGDVERWLLDQRNAQGFPGDVDPTTEDWLVELDEYERRSLPWSLSQSLVPTAPEPTARVAWIFDRLHDLLGDLRSPRHRSAAEWMSSVRRTLDLLYSRSLNSADPGLTPSSEHIQALATAIEEIEAVPPRISEELSMTAAEAIHFFIDSLRNRSVPEPAEPNCIDLIGWLELPFDPAPCVVVTGMNEGIVPARRSPHPLLPESLRRSLGLPAKDAEHARDLFLLTQLVNSRDSLRLVAGQRSADGDPLRPSRLLFACDPSELPARVLASLSKDHIAPGPAAEHAAAHASTAPDAHPPVFVPMPRVEPPPIECMNVTAFGAFLRSPYGFLLEQALRLREFSAVEAEMDPNTFGSALHGTLHDFALSPAAHSVNAEEIHSALTSLLDARLLRGFGRNPPPPLLIQAEHARLRLAVFAEAQARRRAQGWRIAYAEWTPTRPAFFRHGDQSIQIHGRIDRIDVHDSTGQLAVLDYKTGTRTDSVERDHRAGSGAWRNLQLPLYRHLVTQLTDVHPVPIDALSLGYIRLGARPDEIGFDLATWDAETLLSADAAAAEVVRRVRSHDFYSLGDHPPKGEVISVIASARPGGTAADLETTDDLDPDEDSPGENE